MSEPMTPSDQELLAAVARAWELADPPPADLAEGVLARLAAEDLEFELLTLVESDAALAGVRSGTMSVERDEVGSWSLEYAGPDYHVHVQLTRTEDRTRLDGWVVPARPLTVELRSEDGRSSAGATVDEHGRFEFAQTPRGLSRLTFSAPPPSTDRPRVTPPFWI